MSEIKSYTAMQILDNAWTSIGNTVWKNKAIEAVIIAGTELTEHYEQQLQELRNRITNLSICDIDTPVFTHTRKFRMHFDYIKKCFTQKQTENNK